MALPPNNTQVEETEAPVRSTKSGAREELNRLWPLFSATSLPDSYQILKQI